MLTKQSMIDVKIQQMTKFKLLKFGRNYIGFYNCAPIDAHDDGCEG